MDTQQQADAASKQNKGKGKGKGKPKADGAQEPQATPAANNQPASNSDQAPAPAPKAAADDKAKPAKDNAKPQGDTAAPAKEDNKGAKPAKEDNKGAKPANDDNKDAKPAKADNKGSKPAKEENNSKPAKEDNKSKKDSNKPAKENAKPAKDDNKTPKDNAKPAKEENSQAQKEDTKQIAATDKGTNSTNPKNVSVGNIAFATTKDAFETWARAASGVQKIEFPISKNTNKSTGTATITFDSESSAQSGAKVLNGSQLDGRTLSARSATQGNRANARNTNGAGAAPIRASQEDIDAVAEHGTLFVANIPLDATQNDVFQFFNTFGTTKECKLLFEGKTQTSRGSAVVSYEDPAVAVLFLKRSKPHMMNGRALRIRAYAPASKQQDTSSSQTIQVHYPVTMTEQDIRRIFEQFGPITDSRVLHTPTLGFAVLVYGSPLAAQAAVAGTHGKEVQGHGKLDVSLSASTLKFTTSQRNSATSQSKFNSRQIEDRQKPLVQFFDAQLEACKKTHKFTCSVREMEDAIEKASSFTGDARARVLYVWLFLLQDSSSPDAAKMGGERLFSEIFANSNALDGIVVGAFEMPLSAPISPSTLPSACKLSVDDIVLRILNKVLAGAPALHKDLLDALENVTAIEQFQGSGMKQHITTLFRFAKSNAPIAPPPTKQANKSNNSSDAFASLKEEWSAVYAQMGMGNVAHIENVFQGITHEISSLRGRCSQRVTDQQDALVATEAQLLRLQNTIKMELSGAEYELASVTPRVEQLTQRKQALINEISVVVQQLEAAQGQYDRIARQHQQTQRKRQPDMSSMDKQKTSLATEVEDLAQRQQQLQETMSKINAAYAHAVERANKQGAANSVIPRDLGKKASAAVQAHLQALLKQILQLKEKRGLFERKLIALQDEHKDMMSLGFGGVAVDITRGVEKLGTELAGVKSEIREIVGEADKIVAWLRGVHNAHQADATFDISGAERTLLEIKHSAA